MVIKTFYYTYDMLQNYIYSVLLHDYSIYILLGVILLVMIIKIYILLYVVVYVTQLFSIVI